MTVNRNPRQVYGMGFLNLRYDGVVCGSGSGKGSRDSVMMGMVHGMVRRGTTRYDLLLIIYYLIIFPSHCNEHKEE
jgi:hypothetical protein